MRQVEEREGVYRIGAAKALLGTVRRVLPHALPSVAFDCGAFGWIGGAVPGSRTKAIATVVEFLGASEFRILAYIDRYGRVFATDRPVPSRLLVRRSLRSLGTPSRMDRTRNGEASRCTNSSVM